MEIGITFTNAEYVAKLVGAARQNGLYIVSGTDVNIQLMPQLNLDRKILDDGLSRLTEAFKTTL
jgi:acetylornithine/succinyldiaminopimelate/putrescine aminotransferase